MVKNIKTLGLTIERTINFQQHLDNKAAEIAILTSNIDRISGIQWGVTQETIKIKYYSVVQPQILDASQVWFDRIKLSRVKKIKFYANQQSLKNN